MPVRYIVRCPLCGRSFTYEVPHPPRRGTKRRDRLHMPIEVRLRLYLVDHMLQKHGLTPQEHVIKEALRRLKVLYLQESEAASSAEA
ncbi:hypothetical protein DRN94_002565 [archaeon]|nr:hypothetical protein [archaeon]